MLKSKLGNFLLYNSLVQVVVMLGVYGASNGWMILLSIILGVSILVGLVVFLFDRWQRQGTRQSRPVRIDPGPPPPRR